LVNKAVVSAAAGLFESNSEGIRVSEWDDAIEYRPHYSI